MDKNMIKKVSSILLIVLAFILILSVFFRSDSSAIVGKWELAPTESSAVGVYEFYKDNTGVKYNVFNNGDAYGSETFSYKLHDSQITIDFFGVSRIYSYELSGKNLLIDGKLYSKAGGASSIPWVRYILAIIFFGLAFALNKADISGLITKAKKDDYKSYITGKMRVTRDEEKPEVLERESVITEDKATKSDVVIEKEAEIKSEIRTEKASSEMYHLGDDKAVIDSLDEDGKLVSETWGHIEKSDSEKAELTEITETDVKVDETPKSRLKSTMRTSSTTSAETAEKSDKFKPAGDL